MKKVWLVLLALVLVFGLGMVSCGGGDDGDDGKKPDPTIPTVEKEVFDLATDAGIQALALGVLAFSADNVTPVVNPIKPLMRAGGDAHITTEAIKGPGDQAVALKFTTAVTWGAGIDMNFSAFGFAVGDVVKVTGKVITGTGKVQFNSTVGAENAIGEGSGTKAEGEEFEITATLTAAHVNGIKGGSPAALRLEARASGMTLEIYNINIKGQRPVNTVKLATPVVTATATGISWIAVEGAGGYKVYCAEGDGDFDVLSTEGASATSKNIANDPDIDEGTYKFKVVAVGVTGVSTDSDESNVVTYTKVIGAVPEFEITVDGAAVSVGIESIKGSVEVTEDGDGFTFTYPESGANVAYGNSYAFFKVDFGTGTLADYSEVKFTFKGEGGDVPYKNIYLKPFTEKPTASLVELVGNIGHVATGYDGVIPKDFTFKISDSDFDEESVLYFAVPIWANNALAGVATSYTFTNIEFVKDTRVVFVPHDFPDFSNAKKLGPANSTNQWTFGADADKHGTLSDIYTATYFVIASYGGANEDHNEGGYGGVQFSVQGDGTGANGWAGSANIKNTGDWTGFSHDKGDVVFYVIDLAQFPHIAALQADTKPVSQVQFYINYGANTLEECVGYVTTADLGTTKPSDAAAFTHASADLKGNSYITMDIGLTPAP
jgi:hypothetical protein